jgi:RHS repeat-associated protein
MMMAVMAAAFVVVTAFANGPEPKFHPAPGIAPVVGRYLVTLDPSVTADVAHASAEALAQAYVGQLEPYASPDIRQFAIAMLPPRARALSADSRVREVVEIAHPDDALAPPPPPSSATAGLTRQQLVPITRDSSSSGTYLYDGSGNIKSIGTDSFLYDSVGRLKVAIVQGNQQTFTYDPFGNRTATVTANGAIGCVGGCDVPDTAVTPQNNNHLAAATYDDAGNVKTGFGAVYTYDGTGMARRAAVGSDIRDFVYTADDERIAVRQGASWTWTVRDQGGKVLREFTSLETSSSPLTLTSHYWSKDYVWRSGLLLASVFPITSGSMSPTTTYHYHLDHLGTPRLVTKELGVLVGKHSYYPFGAEMNLTPTESAVELMKFTGHERDIVAATNGSVDYMHARYYNPTVARFLSVDPGRDWDTKQPQSWNLYSYVRNNPVTNRDPDGKICIPCIGALVGGTVGLVAESYRQSRGVIVNGIPADNRKLGAAFVAGAVSGAIGASCGGCRLVMSAGAGLAGTTIGGVLGRALDGEHTAKQVVDGKAMLKDGAAGAIGGAVGYGVAAGTVEPTIAANRLGESAARESAIQNNLGQGFFEIGQKQRAVKDAIALSVGVGTAVGETTSTVTANRLPGDKDKP